MNPQVLLFVGFIVVIIPIMWGGVFFFFRPWIRATLSGTPIPMPALLAMRFRGAPALLITDAYIQLHHRGSSATLADVQKVHLAQRQRIRTSSELVDLVERKTDQSKR